MRIAVLTTSYPRSAEDVAGRFVADAVQRVRARGVEVQVIGPQQFRNFRIAYGHGMLGNLRRRPWLALFVPPLLASFVRAARRVEADLLHAHWLPAGWSRPEPVSPMSSRSGERISSSRAGCRGSHEPCCVTHASSSRRRLPWASKRAGSARASSG